MCEVLKILAGSGLDRARSIGKAALPARDGSVAKNIEKLTLGRRALVGGALAAGVSAAAARPVRAAAAPNPFALIQNGIGGLVGVAAVDTATGRLVGHWPDMRFALCSTFKWLLAARALALADAGELALDEMLAFGAADLLEHAPAVKANVARGRMPVADLCKAMVEVSDNTAANLVLARTGGPPGFTAFCRSFGDAVTRLDRTEPALNTNFNGDPRDTTTPRAMAEALRRVLAGDVLAPASRARLIGWMVASDTGRARLRAGLPAGWTAGDKTGTGARGAVNDVAIAWPPGRPPVVIAAYLSGAHADAPALEAAHAEIARTAVRLLGLA